MDISNSTKIHPMNDPLFRGCDGPPTWYLSHPVSPDGMYTYQQNLDHIVKLITIFFEFEFPVIAPYHTHCLALDNDNPTHFRLGLECDFQVVKALKRIILTGHKLSTGMKGERDVILDMQVNGEGGHIVNLIGVSDDGIRKWLKEYNSGDRYIQSHNLRTKV